MSKIKQLNQFFQTDIWRIRASKLSRRRSFFIMQLRIFILALREFSENKCQLRASALTFYSLISFAPVLAMFFGITNGFGLNLALQEQLLGRFPHQEEVILQMIVFARTFLENAHGNLIAGISVAVLVWIAGVAVRFGFA